METKKRADQVNIGGDDHDQNYRYKRDLTKIRYENHHGVQTVLVNIKTIAKQLQVPVKPIISSIQKKLACKVHDKDGKYTVQTSLTIEQIEKVIQRFIKIFVLCPVCKLPEWDRESCRACGHQKIKKTITGKKKRTESKSTDAKSTDVKSTDAKSTDAKSTDPEEPGDDDESIASVTSVQVQRDKMSSVMHELYDFRDRVLKMDQERDFARSRLKNINSLLNRSWRLEESHLVEWKNLKKEFKVLVGSLENV